MQLALDPTLLTTREAARLLGYTHDYIARMCREREIAATRQGTQWLIDRAEADRFARTHAERLTATRTKLAQVRKSERARPISAAVASPYHSSSLPSPYAARRTRTRTRVVDEVVAVSLALLVASGSATIAESGLLSQAARTVAGTALTAAAGIEFMLEDAHQALKATPAVANGTHFEPIYAEYQAPFSMPEIAIASSQGPFVLQKYAVKTSYFVPFTASADAVPPFEYGAAALSVGVFIRDTGMALPSTLLSAALSTGETLSSASGAVMDAYEQGIYAFAALPEPLARSIVGTLSDIGGATQRVLDAAPSTLAYLYTESALAFGRVGPAVAAQLIQAEIAFGTFLTDASHKVASGSYEAVFASMDALEALPGRINAYAPVEELNGVRTALISAIEGAESARHELVASVNGASTSVRAQIAAATEPIRDTQLLEQMTASVFEAGNMAKKALQGIGW